MKELKAMGKYLKEGSVDTDKVLHPTIEKSFPRGNDLAENPPKKKAWWKIRMNWGLREKVQEMSQKIVSTRVDTCWLKMLPHVWDFRSVGDNDKANS